MPIDPNLIGNAMANWQRPPVYDPLAQFAKIQALKNGIGQQQLQQQALQEGALGLQEKQKAIADADAMANVYKSAYTPDPAGGPPKLDENALYQGLATAGLGAKIPVIQKANAEANKSLADLQKSQTDAAEATQEYLAKGLLDVKSAGYDPAAFTAKIQSALDHKAITQSDAARLYQQFQQDPTTAGVQKIVDSFIAGSQKAQDIIGKQATAGKDIAQGVAATENTALAKEKERVAKVTTAKQALGAATDQASLDQALKNVVTAGATPDEVAQIPHMFSPVAMDQYNRGLQTAQERAQSDIAQQNAAATAGAREETARHNRVQESIEATRNQLTQTAARGDRSYQAATHELDQIGKPVTDAVARLGRLQDTLAQNTPQADALVAPELMTIMAGGAGSGLRINEAEIARTIGGRSKWEDLKAAVNKWQLDPSKATSITPEQRKEIHDLTQVVSDKLFAKQNALDAAYKTVAGSQNPDDHRQAVLAARQAIVNADMGGAGAPAGGGHVIEVNGKHYQYKGTGDTADLKNYNEVPK